MNPKVGAEPNLRGFSKSDFGSETCSRLLLTG